MNYRLFILLMIMASITACAKPKMIVQDYKPEQIIHYSQIENVENISNYVVYLNKGEMIPISINFISELFNIADEEVHLMLKQKVYFRVQIPEDVHFENVGNMSEDEKSKFYQRLIIYISADAKNWAPYTDINAVKQLFGIESGGSISFGMGVTREDGFRIFLNGKTKNANLLN